MKKLSKATATVLLSAVLSAGVLARAEGFEKQKTYSNDFSDVPATEWYASEVKNAYEIGLMNGNGDGTFNGIRLTLILP